jgi:TIR domain
MTARRKKTYDVFVSHAASESAIASEIASQLEAAGLETFRAGAVQPSTNVSEAIWEALAESRALILIISADAPTHAMGMVEIGAAAVLPQSNLEVAFVRVSII